MFDQMGTQFIFIMTLMFILFVGYFRVIFSNMIVESKPIVFDTILFFIWLSLTRYFVIYTNNSFNKYIKPKSPLDKEYNRGYEKIFEDTTTNTNTNTNTTVTK